MLDHDSILDRRWEHVHITIVVISIVVSAITIVSTITVVSTITTINIISIISITVPIVTITNNINMTTTRNVHRIDDMKSIGRLQVTKC